MVSGWVSVSYILILKGQSFLHTVENPFPLQSSLLKSVCQIDKSVPISPPDVMGLMSIRQ